MGEIRWDFPLLGTGNEQGYTNSAIETFKGSDLLENLSREICQNSLDAKDPDSDSPVRVIFTLKHISRDRYPLFAAYRECVDGCKENWQGRMDDRLKNFISTADSMLKNERIPILIASDYNTRGLEGVGKYDSAWHALAHSDGTSVGKSNDSAGSYGIGKNAPFACSDLSMVFYNTYAIDENRAFQGSARLATILKDGKKTQGTGHYLYIENSDNWRPIQETDGCDFLKEFNRTEHGTDIIIVGFNGMGEEENWADQITRAVASSFFLAVQEKKLVVELPDCKIIIDSDSLPNIIEKYKDSPKGEVKKIYEWYQTLSAPDGGQAINFSVLEENDVQLFLKTDNDYHNQVSFFRSSGMRVGEKGYRNSAHFAAVIVIRGEAMNKLLRKAEPVRHNRWDSKLIEDKEESKKAKKSIDEIYRKIRAVLHEKAEVESSTSQDSGEGEYLPDDAGTDRATQEGTDILRVNQKISRSLPVRFVSPGNIQSNSSTGTGENTAGDVFGKRKRKKKKCGEKVVSRQGNTEGVKPGRNGAPLSTLNISTQKSFMLSQKDGLYKIRLQAENDTPEVKLEFYSIGEDNEQEALLVQKYAYNGKTTQIHSKTIGPLELKGGEFSEIFVTFEEKEKMCLNIVATEAI
jgi:hypothetical protein